jgi:alanyl-tRNA synthetase
MTVSEIRKKYLDFFRARGHVIVPSSKLVPENDPTTLFTGSGMQPMLPYFLGEPHPQGTRIADSQKSFRAGDIEEVGDNRHTTFFEMLGNWSFGDYFKDEQVSWMFEFLTKELMLDPDRLYFTCYKGNDALGIPRDTYSAELWQKEYAKIGIEAGIAENPEEDGIRPGEKIFYYDDKKNWWSRVGEPTNMPNGEPGGPDTEMFFDFGDQGQHMSSAWRDTPCHVNCDCGRFVEIGNNVFMEYIKKDDVFQKLPKPNVDFGAGLERMAMAVKDTPDIFLIDTMQVVIVELAAESGKHYDDPQYQKSFRVIADHMRGSTFMITDGVMPSNTDQGYVLRRLIRRSIQHMDKLGIPEGNTIATIATRVIDAYRDQYPELDAMREQIRTVLTGEEEKFRKTLSSGIKEFEKMLEKHGAINGEDAFILFTTYGFPIELTEELAVERGVAIDRRGFEEKMEEHRAQSRSGAEHKFKGGLADSGEVTTMLHTCTHLMLAALRKYLGGHVHQAGSNITAERTRFDFTHPEKVDREILDKVEAYVNEAISKKCDIVIEQMPKEKAQAEGVEGSFWEKYPDVVNVYMVKCEDGTVYSQELCGGPHVKNTGDINGTFTIKKEEASSAGVRRVKAVLE